MCYTAVFDQTALTIALTGRVYDNEILRKLESIVRIN
jgi:hypothetical protein